MRFPDKHYIKLPCVSITFTSGNVYTRSKFNKKINTYECVVYANV